MKERGEKKTVQSVRSLVKEEPVGRLSLVGFSFSWRKIKMYVTIRNVCERRERAVLSCVIL